MLFLAVKYNADSDLYKFFNSSLRGKVLLRKYELTKDIDFQEFKDLIIWYEIEKDPINYK